MEGENTFNHDVGFTPVVIDENKFRHDVRSAPGSELHNKVVKVRRLVARNAIRTLIIL